MDNTRIILVVCFFVALASQTEASFGRRKPILNYLVRYHLGKLRAAKGHVGLGQHHSYPGGYPGFHPQEEHYHHFYADPLPYGHGGYQLQSPFIHPDGHSAHSYFSLHNPQYGVDLNYHHSFNLPPSGPHSFEKF